MVPNIINMKPNRIIMSNMTGKEVRMVETRELIPGMELIVRKGLMILTTLIADTLLFCKRKETQPSITTEKSRMFHASLK